MILSFQSTETVIIEKAAGMSMEELNRIIDESVRDGLQEHRKFWKRASNMRFFLWFAFGYHADGLPVVSIVPISTFDVDESLKLAKECDPSDGMTWRLLYEGQ